MLHSSPGGMLLDLMHYVRYLCSGGADIISNSRATDRLLSLSFSNNQTTTFLWVTFISPFYPIFISLDMQLYTTDYQFILFYSLSFLLLGVLTIWYKIAAPNLYRPICGKYKFDNRCSIFHCLKFLKFLCNINSTLGGKTCVLSRQNHKVLWQNRVSLKLTSPN